MSGQLQNASAYKKSRPFGRLLYMIGVADVNRYLVVNGYKDTQLKRKMMDMAAIREGGENYTSASDLGTFFLRLYHSQCVGERYDAKMRE